MSEVNQPQRQEGGDEPAAEPEMCCDGEKTAAEHRHESADGKCCIDK